MGILPIVLIMDKFVHSTTEKALSEPLVISGAFDRDIRISISKSRFRFPIVRQKGFLSLTFRKWISCFIVKSEIRISQSKAPLDWFPSGAYNEDQPLL